MAFDIQAIKGMKDILPQDTALWQQLESEITNAASSYAYQEIRFPYLEQTKLFKRAIGDVTDIVEKEMYTFVDKSEESVSLRPEGTASCVRALLQHGLTREKGTRVWYMGPMFRRENPQKGRYRQFNQFGVEAINVEGPDVDIEQIFMMWRIFKALHLSEKISLEINSLGTSEERAKYRTTLVGYFNENEAMLDEDSKRRLNTNPLRILDSKNPAMQQLIGKAPKLVDTLGDESKRHFEAVKAGLDSLKIPYSVNPSLVRGLDYYCHTVYEWKAEGLGAQSTVCAGGRYDGLVEQLGGKPTPSCGFAMGLERLMLILDQNQLAKSPNIDVYFIAVGSKAKNKALVLAEVIRDSKKHVALHPGEGSFKSQFKRADKSGAKYAVILGEDELVKQQVTIKPLRDNGEQQMISFSSLKDFAW
jgi:histidyl-tRNA synthetase